MPSGGFSNEIRAFNDFTAIPPITAAGTVPLANGSLLGGGWALHGVNEGTAIATVDEPGGVLACTTDTGDNDNIAVSAGVWQPADGGMAFEARVKIPTSVAANRAAMFVGFTETLSVATPVLPYELSSTTQTYNGTGGAIGFTFDSDATAIRWRFNAMDGGAALATKDKNGSVGGSIGIDAEASVTADRWWVFRIEVGTDGIGRGYILDTAGTSNADVNMRLVGASTSAVGTGDNFHATVIGENRSGNNEEFEIDYVDAVGYRDWSAD